MTINEVWSNIVKNEGETFRQLKGKPFTYTVVANSINLSTTNRNISKKTIEQAMEFLPLDSTAPLQHLQGPSYLYGILTDKRIIP